MTSRGNQSVSPPAQTPQQRHVSTISSSTPPPQQFFPGASSALHQATCEFMPQAQGQPFRSYQAYGSAVNDTRGQPGSSGRSGPPQSSLPQGSGFYQPSVANMRPQQSQQGHTASQQYFLSAQTPTSHYARPPHLPSSQQVMLISQPYPSANSLITIPANVYQNPTVPLFQPNSFATPFQPNVMYYQNGPWRTPTVAPAATSVVRPPREKKVLSIKDPQTGRDITEELLSGRPKSTDTEEHHEDVPPVNQSGKEICQIFTRLVADRLKSPDEPSTSGTSADCQSTVSGAPTGSTATIPSSQYQQPPPQQPVQQQPPSIAQATMMRPPLSGPLPPGTHVIRPGMIQQPPTPATPPHDIQHQVLSVNLSMPPPQFNVRQHAPVMYNSAAQQQHQTHHTPHHPHPLQQQQSIRPQMSPVVPAPVHPHPQHPGPQSAHVPSSSTVNDTVPHSPKVEVCVPEKQKPEIEATSQNDIPVKPAGPPVSFPAPVVRPPSPVKEVPPVQSQTEVVSEVGPPMTPSSVKMAAVCETQVVNKTEDFGKEEIFQGGSTQGVKDGRKGKKNKKDLNRKDIGGSDMDAFIDTQREPSDVDGKPPLPQPVLDRTNSIDKPAAQSFNTPSSPTKKETVKMTNKVPQSQAAVITTPTPQSEVEEKAFISQHNSADAAVPVTSAVPSKNQNQQPVKQSGTNQQSSRRMSGHPEKQNSKPLDNCIAEDVLAETSPVAPDELNEDTPNINHQVFSDENEPPKELIGKQKSEDIRKLQDFKTGQLHGTESDGAPTKALSEKIFNRFKKDGKLHYDRAYLMELRECVSSQTKPEGLPDLEIILDRPVVNTSRGTSAAPLDFTPAFFQPSGGQRHPPQIGKTNSRTRPRSDVQMPQRIIKSVSLQDSVKPLHQSEKPWKPSQKQLSSGETQEKRKSLESEVLFIMNRLTPTNFERLAMEMKKLNINTYEDLQELVKIFFDKVTMETKFVEAYAHLCKVMSGLRIQPSPNSGVKDSQATFRVVMLTKCQQEFEADKTIVFEDPEEKKKKIEGEMPDSPERTALIENTLYQMKLRRLKFYGNIRFIGELFKLNMLTENIMHDCIFRLLKAKDDDSLVSLCNLITTVGQILDTEKAKVRMDQYFAQMAKIAEERKSRIKFTLKDAIDLRNNNWVPRKEQTGPKKIDEVHKDFREEQVTKQLLQSQPLPPRSDANQTSSRRGSRQRQDENKPTDDGWNTVGSRPFRIDAAKMKLSKNVVDENSIQLGPGGGSKQFSMWSRGSYGGAQPSQESDRPAAPANRFSALHGEEDHRNFQRSPSRGDGGVANRGMRQGPTAGYGRGKILARSSQEGERSDALANARSIGRSQNSSRDNSWNRENHRQSVVNRGSREGENAMTRSDISLRSNTDTLPQAAVSPALIGATAAGFDGDLVLKKVKALSEDEMQYKAKTILEEYLSARDLEEAKLCLMELAGQEYLHVFVTTCINEVLERTNKERELTGSFFHEVIIHRHLPMDVYIRGLSEVLQYAEDMVIDIPMMWTYLAQIIVPLLIGGSMSWSTLPVVLRPYLEESCCAKLIADILLLAKERTSEEEVALMWQNNNLDWTAFLPAEGITRFLKERKVEFTVRPVSRTSSRATEYSQIDLQRISDEVESIVRENGTSSKIYAYVDAHIPVEKRDRHFIRALVTAVVNAAFSVATMKFNDEVIKSHKDVLLHYIKSNPELELQALYAIQSLMHKLEHPSGVIANIFDTLYDEEVISEETFKQWEKSSDPQELEGKGACSMQLTQFFAWLRENEEPETS